MLAIMAKDDFGFSFHPFEKSEFKFKIQKDLVEILGVGNSPLVT